MASQARQFCAERGRWKMPQTPHIERHFTGSATIRDIVIGMSDGLTVPFALAAGLSAVTSSAVVVTAGLAEIAAGSISMGLGGYLAARSDMDHYDAERVREDQEVSRVPAVEAEEVSQVFQQYGLTAEESTPIVAALSQRRKPWIDFMMRFELGLERPDPNRMLISALTIALSYAAGGAVPLSPYFFISNTQKALIVSVVLTLIALALFGYTKARFTGVAAFRGALQTTVIGGVASAAAFLIARLVS
jgi:vacuolar iron transporter family protein